MKRRLATALAAATLAALSLTARLDAAQTNGGIERTGEKTTKVVRQSCPVHPEFKTRSAGRCPKCRADERKMRSAREKGVSRIKRRPQSQEGAAPDE
jgi:hypothetical protein